MFGQPVFVISCDRDQERKDILTERCQERGLSFEWFRAVDGYETSPTVFHQEQIHIPNEPGSSGCALSHKNLWKKMVEEDIPSCFIMEDDILFHEEFDELAPLFWSMSPKEGMIFLGHCCLHGRPNEMNILEGMPLAIHAYYMTQKVARWFLDHFGKCEEHIDLHMRNLYYQIPHEWKCFAWWDGRRKSQCHQKTRLGVVFNGLIVQDHELENSISRKCRD